MKFIVNLYSTTTGEIKKFLELFYQTPITLSDELFWENSYNTPTDMIELISCFIDNKDNFKINLWISFDNGIFLNVTEKNLDDIIRYIYERW